MKRLNRVFLTASLLATASFASAVELVSNGNFDLGSSDWVEVGSYTIVDAHGVGAFGTSGNKYAWLGGYDDAEDSLSQVINFGSLAGSATLSFDFEAGDFDFSGWDFFMLKLGGVTLDTIDLGDFADTLTGISTKTYDVSTFVGTGNRTLEFLTTTDSSSACSAFVDNVSINATVAPEPGTMAALGLGAMALIRRRRA